MLISGSPSALTRPSSAGITTWVSFGCSGSSDTTPSGAAATAPLDFVSACRTSRVGPIVPSAPVDNRDPVGDVMWMPSDGPTGTRRQRCQPPLTPTSRGPSAGPVDEPAPHCPQLWTLGCGRGPESGNQGIRESALHHVDGEPALRGLLVLAHHVPARLPHGLHHRVQAHGVRPVPPHGDPRRIDGLHGRHGVALDAGDLHQTTDRVAGQPEVCLLYTSPSPRD